MTAWQIWIILGVLFLIIEGFTPFLFFLTISMACFIACIVALIGLASVWQVLTWVIASVLLLVFQAVFIENQKQRYGCFR